MEKIFDTNSLYPGYVEPLKKHFSAVYDEVFVSLSPFFKVKGKNEEETAVSGREIVSLEEIQKKDGTFKNFQPSDNRVIYSSNPNYPIEIEIAEKGITVTWQYILENAGFKSLQEISLALKTSIGGLNKEYRTPELQEVLEKFTVKNSIYHPTEGRITVLSLIKIYHCLIEIRKAEIVIADEFFQDSEKIDLSTLTCEEFILKVRGYVYFFPVDKTLLFTIEWDSFFFLICGDGETIEQIVTQFDFEGFLCDENTRHNWDTDD